MSLGSHIALGRMDELARADTPLHRLDARTLALTTLAFLVAVMSFPRYEVSALMPFFLYPFALAGAAQIPPSFLLRRVLVAAPFAVLLGLFNPFLDRQPMAALGPLTLSGGWLSFASILVRFALTVSAALILVACTGIHRLCAGLERMGLPRVFAVQLLFLHRYLFVVVDEGQRMQRALDLRSAGARHPPLRVYGAVVGHLLLRAMDRAQRIYRAMAARGFDGDVRTLRAPSLRWADAAFLGAWSAFFAAARVWNVAGGLGRWLTGGGA